jgi:hypothetical protein
MRQSRAWWTETVTRWQRSGLTARSFAQRERIAVSTLRWWSAKLSRDTRAKHGSTAIAPIEITVPSVATESRTGSRTIEIATGSVVIRVEVGTDVAYVAALVQACEGR